VPCSWSLTLLRCNVHDRKEKGTAFLQYKYCGMLIKVKHLPEMRTLRSPR
jgi:hypothetical protein